MNDLLNILRGIAPAVATAVAGPAGGLIVSALANKFGVKDAVEDVAKAIAGDPEAARKLAELDLEKLKADSVNKVSPNSIHTDLGDCVRMALFNGFVRAISAWANAPELRNTP